MLTATRSGTWHSSALVSSETVEDRPSGWCQLLVLLCMSSLNQGRLKGAAVMTEMLVGMGGWMDGEMGGGGSGA